MEINENLCFDIKELYQSFVFTTLTHHHTQLNLISPNDMYEEYTNREKILSTISDLCKLYMDKTETLLDIFKDWSIYLKDNSPDFVKQIEDLFEFMTTLSNIVIDEDTINELQQQYTAHIKRFNKEDIPNLTPEDIITNEELALILEELVVEELTLNLQSNNFTEFGKLYDILLNEKTISNIEPPENIRPIKEFYKKQDNLISNISDLIIFAEENINHFIDFSEYYIKTKPTFQKHIHTIFKITKILTTLLTYKPQIEKWEFFLMRKLEN